MLHDEIAGKLLDLEIFRGLPKAVAQRIARRGERIVLRAGQTMIRADETGNAAFLLVAGEAVAHADDGSAPVPVPLGALVGELAMLVEHTFRVTVTCVGPVRAVRLERSAILDEIAASPDLADHLVTRLGSRLTRVAIELRRLDEMLALATGPALLTAR